MSETAQLTVAGWSFLAVGAALAIAGLWLVTRMPSDGQLAGWARRYDCALTASTRPVVARYRRRTRTLQVAGAALGFLASPLYVGFTSRAFPLGDSWVLLAVGGYLVGTVLAEAASFRPYRATIGMRAASLSPRTLTDYVPAATIWAIRVLPLAVVALCVVYGLMPKSPQQLVDPSVPFVIVSTAVVVVFAGVVEASLRAVVARPQPATTEDCVAADDAIRASSIHALSAAAIALLILSLGWILVSMGTAMPVSLLSQVFPWLGLLTDVGALVAWLGLGHPRSWHVRRGEPLLSPR
jgi:hypothetical protein